METGLEVSDETKIHGPGACKSKSLLAHLETTCQSLKPML